MPAWLIVCHRSSASVQLHANCFCPGATTFFVALSSVAGNGFRRKLLCLNPAIRAVVEQVEREDAAIQHLVVEGADVELGTQFVPSAFAEFDELELSQLVTKGL